MTNYKYTVMQFTSQFFVILFTFIKGAICIETKVIYTKPRSTLQLNTSEFEPSINCDLSSKYDQWKRSNIIVNTSGEYDKEKYQIRSKLFKLNVRIPEVHGTFYNDLATSRTTRTLKLLDMMSSQIDELSFTYSWIPFDYFGFQQYGGYVDFFFQFHLKIHRVVPSIKDAGQYDCKLSFPFGIELIFGKTHFLNQTDDNIIYGQEGMSTNISCTTATGYDPGELSIQQNNTILAISNSSIVTFSFIPKRQDSFTQYRCVGNDSTLADVYIKLVIKYAPDVIVVVKENSIDCIPNGFPSTYTFKKWDHQSPQGIHIRFLDGLQNGTLVLQRSSQQYQLNGRYICSVSNGIPGLDGRMFQKGFGSVIYSGAPIFVTENRKVKIAVPGENFTMSFFVYSNPIVENIWIGMTDTDLTRAYKMNFGISKAALMYTASRENGNINGCEIVIETDIFRRINIQEYTIWAENKLGVDSYQFQILEDDQCYSEDINQLIVSGSIATVLAIYLFVSHVCFCVRVRKKRTMQPNIQEPLNNHVYDDIGPITNQEVNEHLLTTGNQELNQHIGVLQYPQDESATTHRNSPDPMNDNMDNTDISSTVSEQERSSNELHHGNPSELHDNRSTVHHDVTTYNEQISGDEPATSTDQDGVAQPFRTGNDQDSNRMSKNSTSSDESNGSTLGCVSFSDGYENPYQSIMTANQETHQYCDLTNIPE